jgi:hypothetical protein
MTALASNFKSSLADEQTDRAAILDTARPGMAAHVKHAVTTLVRAARRCWLEAFKDFTLERPAGELDSEAFPSRQLAFPLRSESDFFGLYMLGRSIQTGGAQPGGNCSVEEEVHPTATSRV